jgi:hypothetical protein
MTEYLTSHCCAGQIKYTARPNNTGVPSDIRQMVNEFHWMVLYTILFMLVWI